MYFNIFLFINFQGCNTVIILLFNYFLERNKFLEILRNNRELIDYGEAMIKIRQRNRIIEIFSYTFVVVVASVQLFFLYSQGRLLFTFVNFNSNLNGFFSTIFHFLNFFCSCVFTYAIAFGPIFFVKTFYFNINVMELITENIVINLKGNEQDVVYENLKQFLQKLEEVSK